MSLYVAGDVNECQNIIAKNIFIPQILAFLEVGNFLYHPRIYENFFNVFLKIQINLFYILLMKCEKSTKFFFSNAI